MTRIQVGKIISTHGIDGEVKIWPYNQSDNFYEQLSYVYFNDEEDLIKSFQHALSRIRIYCSLKDLILLKLLRNI